MSKINQKKEQRLLQEERAKRVGLDGTEPIGEATLESFPLLCGLQVQNQGLGDRLRCVFV